MNFAALLNDLARFSTTMGFALITWQQAAMLVISCVLIYLAIHHKFEPLLLLPIGFGALLANLPMTGIIGPHDPLITPTPGTADFPGAILYYLYKGVELDIFPCLIFLGLGAMTDFGPLLASPVTFLLGAAAQFGVFGTLFGAILLGFPIKQACSIAIIGGADGPTAIYLTSKMAPELLGPIAVAAYSYMSLVPLIQPPIMRLLTTKKERLIRMPQLRPVSRTARIVFPIVVTIVTILIVPPAGPLIGMLMLGNLLRESGVVERLSKSGQNEIINVTTLFVGLAVGGSMTGGRFLQIETIKIILLGLLAFSFGTAAGVILGKILCWLTHGKINPLIGAAGVSAVPMAARVVQKVGQAEDPGNFLLMNAMGPNVAGVIGTAIAAGVLLSLVG